MKKIIIAIIMILTFSTSVMAASKLDELEAREKEQAKKVLEMQRRRKAQQSEKWKIDKELRNVSRQISANNNAIASIFRNISKLEQEISDMGLEVDELKLQIDKKNIEIDKVKAELDEIRSKKEKLKKRGALRIKSIYENGKPSLYELILESKSISDFFNAVEYTNKLVESDNKLFDELKEMEVEAVAIESSLEIEEDTLGFMVKDKELKMANLGKKVNNRSEEMRAAQKLLDKQKEKKSEINSKKHEVEKELSIILAQEKALDRELDKIIAQKQMEINNMRGVKYTGGKFIWPLPGYKRISSPFGYRVHPISRRRNFHNGVDVPAPRGVAILSAGSGEVVQSKYHYSYGNYVAVVHGDGYLTLYAHMSKRSVKVGDTVKAGQKLGEIGTTGSSTGNHLHFGVKKGNHWKNPFNYTRP